MKFTKMHGAGNDYIYVNCFEEKVEDRNALAKKISDRHFGIGSDGLVFIEPSESADFKMDMYNSDGSQGKMCGNAVRCVAKFVYDNAMTDKTEISLETLSGIKYIKVETLDGKVSTAAVDMGVPILEPKKIPVNTNTEAADIVMDEKITVDGKNYQMTCVSMGNPHCVVFVDDVNKVNIDRVGPLFENSPLFPDRINTEFVRVIDSNTIEMRVWERGAGETLACGTGACASVVACILNGFSEKDKDIKVILRGGELSIRWDSDSGSVFMTGPAETVFTGEIDA